MRTIVEESMLELMYDIPSDDTITKVVIDKEFIMKQAPARILRRKVKATIDETLESGNSVG